MIEKLRELYNKYKEIELKLQSPEAMKDMQLYIKLNKDYKDLEAIANAYIEYDTILKGIDEAKELLINSNDVELKAMAKEELTNLEENKINLEEKIKILLLPNDPQDSKNAIVEIRAGTGGDEASIFAGDLFRMYSRFAERQNWKLEIVNYTEGTAGGYKEIIFNIIGTNAYGTLKFESGVHRVQRIPLTESQGRIHTSAASVVVFPEADDFDVKIDEKDIKKEIFCSSGHGGQSVNTTYSAVRLTHIPTGISVSCQDERSQTQNLQKAYNLLRSRIFQLEYQKYLDDISHQRKTMVSTGDRSAKIRTYNYPQNRVTDHRIGLTLYNLTDIMDGDLNELIDALQVAENTEKLKAEIE
ncbi:MAG: peptide chain release factor 1 [Bacteroidales bacterium]|jgi:peptide chain release factor 1|nr:peptide chain release factor 1 [Bacteroidales bacterium]MDI9576152.1 peptide chain release factor 1 [Bacteroidota bacterium]MDY0401715.1 peptide chain release factor 1 [Bacteroidales bacterium]HPZ61807.1 peptide chain release factor 1 [Bacteroidales bacterium]